MRSHDVSSVDSAVKGEAGRERQGVCVDSGGGGRRDVAGESVSLCFGSMDFTEGTLAGLPGHQLDHRYRHRIHPM